MTNPNAVDRRADLSLRWATMIIGLVLAICGGTIAYCRTIVDDLEVRVRAVERNAAGNTARFEAIKESLMRLEGRK